MVCRLFSKCFSCLTFFCWIICPTICMFRATIARATYRSKPWMPWSRQRSRPWFSRAFIEDSTAECLCLAWINSSDCSISLLIADSLPFLGRMTLPSIAASSSWFFWLWKPLSKLQLLKSENLLIVSSIIGTAILSSVSFCFLSLPERRSMLELADQILFDLFSDPGVVEDLRCMATCSDGKKRKEHMKYSDPLWKPGDEDWTFGRTQELSNRTGRYFLT